MKRLNDIRLLSRILLIAWLAVLLPGGYRLAAAHGGHTPGLLGDPNAPPPNAQVLRDPAGRLLYVEIDSNQDGRPDVWNHYEKGVLARQEIDENRDGKADVRLFIMHDEVLRGEMDANGDGMFEVEEIYEKGRLLRQSLDSNRDGKFDTTHFVENDVHSRTEADTDFDGKTDRWTFYAGDEKPRLVMEDTNNDGIPDNRIAFDEQGRPIPSHPENDPAEKEEPVENLAGKDDLLLDEIVVKEKRALTAASDKQVRQRDFISFPRQNPSDLVRLIPGVHVSQHTGGAKAYQYFLRGFDAEHGQDLAASLDGIPLNEPSQVHGHGYLDLHFLIPETIAEVRIIKGPYDPEFGNFATAGAIDFVPRRTADYNQASATAGMFGAVRVLGAFGLEADPYLLVGAAETDHTDGYTDPGYADAFRVNTGQTFLLDDWTLNLLTCHYGQDSAATDVIPESLVEDGQLSRFGSLDPSDRVTSNLHLAGLTADWQKGAHSLRLQGFYDWKRTAIWSNYTFYLLNPDRGDQQEMLDQRDVAGVNLRYSNVAAWGPTIWTSAIGAQWRLDAVRQVLANTTDRTRWNVINDLDFDENALGVWFRENVSLTPWLTIVPGLRFDQLLYAGKGTQDERYFNIYTNMADTHQDVSRDWNETASIFSPKASVIFTPLRPWDIFLNYGEGFFSNTSLQMANDPRNTIPKVRGAEIGTRFFLWNDRITLAAAAWAANKEEDLVFDPQTGISSIKETTKRTGLDGELRVAPWDWLYLITDASYVDARFAETGERIPNGPIFLMTNGIGWMHDIGVRGMVRGRYMGPRELDQDDWAPPYYVVDLVAGFDTRRWGLELAVDNVLDTEWEDAVFSYETRPERNGETKNGIHWTPGSPLFARFTVTAKF